MTQAKERPILFSAPMVRAILSGQKTVTRRAVKTTKAHADGFMMLDHGNVWWPYNAFGDFTSDHEGMEYPIACPYGKHGDRLWVRESLGYDCEYGHYFAAGGMHGETVYLCSLFDDDDAQAGPSYDGLLPERSVPSIHLHRRYSRILLEITDVRVEPLQSINEDQAKAEGVRLYTDHAALGDWWHVEGIETYSADPRKSFELLWTSVGGDWNSNPWVWVVEFKRVMS
ncbi:hypothetical protein CCL15_22500 [Pseudomonas syringae]|uniref:hypothetical protein n=1 Tax=Pseudomonas syringae TaxID=317 RepID=UPI000BB65B5C|nr:hypothetical protein [Pseudomonas syringae]PBP66000.1 hypothetical protein CCL15_22500 [Pseudomonas syringae]